MGAFLFTALKASIIALNQMQEVSGSHGGRGSHGRIWEDCKQGMLQNLDIRGWESRQERVAVVQEVHDQRLDQELCHLL